MKSRYFAFWLVTTAIVYGSFLFLFSGNPAYARDVDYCRSMLQDTAQEVKSSSGTSNFNLRQFSEYTEYEKDCQQELDKGSLITPSQVSENQDIANPVQNSESAQAELDPPDPSEVGQWEEPFDWPLIPIHMHVLPTGKVLAWHRPKLAPASIPQSILWDPVTGNFNNVPPVATDIFCAGHAFAPSGRLLVAGGHIGSPVPDDPNAPTPAEDGSPDTNVYDTFNNRWFSFPNSMNDARWYPTVTYRFNGEATVVGGSIERSTSEPVTILNEIPQWWDGTWHDLPNAQLGLSVDPYAWMYPAPSGRVYQAGPEKRTRVLNPTGVGQWITVSDRNGGNRFYGSSVMYGDGKILVVGGSNTPTGTPTNTAEVVELLTSNAWRYVDSMQHPRRHHNATLLPDGKVFVAGGTSKGTFNDDTGAVLEAEMWDPISENWSTMDSMSIKRLYHSTALLLPDARVLMAGGGLPAGETENLNSPVGPACINSPYKQESDCQGHYDAQIYDPPYLFKGSRPTINNAPTNVSYNQMFSVVTNEADDITQVNLVRLPSVTHDFNENQGFKRLSFTTTENSLIVTAPSDPKLAPPGYYMMFILNSNCVPSVAKIVQLS